MAGWQSGYAAACKAVYAGSIPASASIAYLCMNLSIRSSKRISVLIPSYNQEDIITNILESIENQDFFPLEVIVIDDCSKDNTFNVLQDYKKKSELNIKLIKNETNLGIYGNVDKLINHANGDVICMLGGDDIFYDECFAKLEMFLGGLDLDGNLDKFLAITNFLIEYPTKKSRLFNNYQLRKKNHFGHIIREDLGWRGFGMSKALAKSLGSREELCNSFGSLQYAADQIINLDEYINADHVFFLDITASIYVAGIGVSNNFDNTGPINSIKLNKVIRSRYKPYLNKSDLRYLDFRDKAANFQINQSLPLFFKSFFSYILNIGNFGKNSNWIIQAKFLLPIFFYKRVKSFYHKYKR